MYGRFANRPFGLHHMAAFILHIIAVTAMSIPNVLGYNLIFGKGKILHFGPIGVSAVTAYATFVTLGRTDSYFAAIAVGIVAALLVSGFFAWLSFRLEADALGILTIAVHLAFLTVILNWPSVTRGALGIPKIPRLPFIASPEAFVAVVTGIAALWIAFFWLLNRSAYGRKLDALSEHEWHATSLGIDRRSIHLAAFLIGGLCSASANIFYPQFIHLLHPSDYGFPYLIFFVMCVVAGKPGSVLGVTLATVLLTFLREGLRFLPFPSAIMGPMRLLLFGAILLATVWYRRDTLFPKKRTI